MQMEYKVKTAMSFEIAQHLKACDASFVPSLSGRVDIDEYASKIEDKAITFEAWQGKELAGLVAVYINVEALTAFITNVSVLTTYGRSGIANELLKNCINFLKNKNVKKVSLEVGVENIAALELYKKFNFIECGSNAQIKMLELEIV